MAKRLFIALELPESCRDTLANLNPHVKGSRWLPAEQLHVTMSFIGHLNSTQEERLREALGKVRVPAFFLPIQGVGTFGGAQPSVVWAGLGKDIPICSRSTSTSRTPSCTRDWSRSKPFHPHITLGRANGVSEATLLPFLRRNAEIEFGLWKVTSFAMFSSVLTSEGAIYTVETRREF